MMKERLDSKMGIRSIRARPGLYMYILPVAFPFIQGTWIIFFLQLKVEFSGEEICVPF
jgi:hypothetical protein